MRQKHRSNSTKSNTVYGGKNRIKTTPSRADILKAAKVYEERGKLQRADQLRRIANVVGRSRAGQVGIPRDKDLQLMKWVADAQR